VEVELAKRVNLIARERYLGEKKDLKTTLGELLTPYVENHSDQTSQASGPGKPSTWRDSRSISERISYFQTTVTGTLRIAATGCANCQERIGPFAPPL
jgi:hypothetical protein